MHFVTTKIILLAIGLAQVQVVMASPPLDPVYIKNISQKFGVWNSTQEAYHTGVDISTPGANPNVYAIADGIVVWNSTASTKYTSAHEKYFNAFLIVKHSDCFAYYGHLTSSLAVNEKVEKGKVIGTIRNAYSYNNALSARANHLHISISTEKDWLRNAWGYRVVKDDLRLFVTPESWFQESSDGLGFSKALESVWGGIELNQNQIANLTTWELKVLRNAVLARHGREFESAKLSVISRICPKYKIDSTYSERMLTAVDQSSIKTIQAVEKMGKLVDPVTSTNALRAFLAAMAGGDVESIHRLVHPDLPLTKTRFDIGPPPKLSSRRKYVKSEISQLDDYWLADGMNGVAYCFMMTALWDFTLLPNQTSEGVFKNKYGTEIGFTKRDGKWWLTTVSDVTP